MYPMSELPYWRLHMTPARQGRWKDSRLASAKMSRREQCAGLNAKEKKDRKKEKEKKKKKKKKKSKIGKKAGGLEADICAMKANGPMGNRDFKRLQAHGQYRGGKDTSMAAIYTLDDWRGHDPPS